MEDFITYSRNVFLPLTRVCRNHCAYCGFKQEVREDAVMSLERVDRLLQRGAEAGCSEALFTFGERPWEVEGFLEQLWRLGFDSFIDYLLECARHAISKGLLPHINPGVVPLRDLKELREVSASMGLMLETTAEVEAHLDSPGKQPRERIKCIEHAGRLRIPFTTGILIGIGESRGDRIESLETIARLHRRYGHIQEVILQNFLPKPGTPLEGHQPPPFEVMLETVGLARRILPDDVSIQIPPNLVAPRLLVSLVSQGARDIGGVSSVSIDHINPEAPWPGIRELENLLHLPLRERLPIYPRYVKAGWYSEEIAPLIGALSDEDGFRKL